MNRYGLVRAVDRDHYDLSGCDLERVQEINASGRFNVDLNGDRGAAHFHS